MTIFSSTAYIDPYISVHPSSLLVPTGTEAVLSCQANCAGVCDIYWIIGNTMVNLHHKPQFERLGYAFSTRNAVNNTYMATVAINASWSVNTTQFQCYVILDGVNTFAARSSRAVLFVISGVLYS